MHWIIFAFRGRKVLQSSVVHLLCIEYLSKSFPKDSDSVQLFPSFNFTFRFSELSEHLQKVCVFSPKVSQMNEIKHDCRKKHLDSKQKFPFLSRR